MSIYGFPTNNMCIIILSISKILTELDHLWTHFGLKCPAYVLQNKFVFIFFQASLYVMANMYLVFVV
jgi:hypothetical protein